jgi:transposase
VKWLQRWSDTGSAKAKPTGGSTSPLEEHVEWLLALVAEQPDLTPLPPRRTVDRLRSSWALKNDHLGRRATP